MLYGTSSGNSGTLTCSRTRLRGSGLRGPIIVSKQAENRWEKFSLHQDEHLKPQVIAASEPSSLPRFPGVEACTQAVQTRALAQVLNDSHRSMLSESLLSGTRWNELPLINVRLPKSQVCHTGTMEL